MDSVIYPTRRPSIKLCQPTQGLPAEADEANRDIERTMAGRQCIGGQTIKPKKLTRTTLTRTSGTAPVGENK